MDAPITEFQSTDRMADEAVFGQMALAEIKAAYWRAWNEHKRLEAEMDSYKKILRQHINARGEDDIFAEGIPSLVLKHARVASYDVTSIDELTWRRLRELHCLKVDHTVLTKMKERGMITGIEPLYGDQTRMEWER